MTNNKFKNKPNKVCYTDTGHVWHSRSCVVIGHIHCIINDGHTEVTDDDIYVLVGTRGSGKHKGFYNCPTGYLDWSENIENAMYREVYEEAGLYLPDFEKNIRYKTKDQPWFINSEPSVTLQNILFHCGVLMEVDTVADLPPVHLNNMEKDECENIEWIKLSDVRKIPERFCFNHHLRIFEFHRHCYENFKGIYF